MVNGIDSLISISNFSLLVYRNQVISMYSIKSSADSEHLTSFLIWIPCIPFSSLIAIAKTSKTMLNNNDNNIILVFFLLLEEMLSVFHH